MSDDDRAMQEEDWEKLDAAIEADDLDSLDELVVRFEELRSQEIMSENLSSAVRANKLNVVKYFVEHGADVNYQDPDIAYHGALHAACGKGFLELAKYLFSQGAIMRTDKDSNPLMSAIHNRHAHIVRWLLTTDMDINAKELTAGGGYTNPLRYASNWGQEDEIVVMLKQAGARLPDDAVETAPRELPPPTIDASSTLAELQGKIDGEIYEVLKEDIRIHLNKLRDAGVNFYGYAIQTPNWLNVDQPIVVYNCDSDIADGDHGDFYLRYSVDEWQHYETDALLATSSCLSVVKNDMERLRVSSDSEDAICRAIYKMFALVLNNTRVATLVDESVALVIWCDDEELMTQTARELNSKNFADRFEAEFGV